MYAKTEKTDKKTDPAQTLHSRRKMVALPLVRASAPWTDDLDQNVRDVLRLPDRSVEAIQPCDIVVVGAGVAGLNAALGARSAGARVLVLEAASSIGTGATGRNAGILSAGINMGLADLPPGSPESEMWPATTKELLTLAREAELPGTLLKARLTGSFSLAETRAAARHLVREAEARTRAGLQAQIWSAEAVSQATDGRLDTSTVLEALWLPDEGRIQPLTLLAHLAECVRRADISIVGNSPVVRWEATSARDKKTGWTLYLADGATMKASGLVVATGPTVEPTGRLYALTFFADLPETFPLFWDSAPYTYCDFRAGQGRLTVSGGRYGRPGAVHRDYIYHGRLADAARHWLPELRTQHPVYAWAVDIAVSAGMVPEARRIDGLASGLTIVGLGALGVLPGSILGRRAGERLAQEIA